MGSEGGSARVLTVHDSRFVFFHLADELFAVPITAIDEIQSLPSMTRVPGSRREVFGVMNLRGEVLTILDIRPAMQVPLGETTPDTRLLVLTSGQGRVGVLVDRVLEIDHVPASEQRPSPEDSAARRMGIRAVFFRRDRLVSLIDLGEVLTSLHARTGTAG